MLLCSSGHCVNFFDQYGAAFATGLCPIAGRYGKRFGVLAGIMCAIMCTSKSALHGGFVLYNGGLTSGITALILVPCLEYYWEGRKKRSLNLSLMPFILTHFFD